jgi:hypothetical protein
VLDGAATHVEPGEQSGVIGYSTPGSTAFGNHEARYDMRRSPAAVRGEHRCDPQLDIEATEEVADVPDAGLDLGHVEDRCRRMEREQVDPSAVAVVVEASLGPHLPRRRRLATRPRVLKPCVIGIEEPIEVPLAAPERMQGHAGIECPENPPQRRDGIPIHAAELHVRDSRHTHAGSGSEVPLAPPASVTERADGPADAPIVHRLRMAPEPLSAAYHRRMARAASAPERSLGVAPPPRAALIAAAPRRAELRRGP